MSKTTEPQEKQQSAAKAKQAKPAVKATSKNQTSKSAEKPQAVVAAAAEQSAAKAKPTTDKAPTESTAAQKPKTKKPLLLVVIGLVLIGIGIVIFNLVANPQKQSLLDEAIKNTRETDQSLRYKLALNQSGGGEATIENTKLESGFTSDPKNKLFQFDLSVNHSNLKADLSAIFNSEKSNGYLKLKTNNALTDAIIQAYLKRVSTNNPIFKALFRLTYQAINDHWLTIDKDSFQSLISQLQAAVKNSNNTNTDSTDAPNKIFNDCLAGYNQAKLIVVKELAADGDNRVFVVKVDHSKNESATKCIEKINQLLGSFNLSKINHDDFKLIIAVDTKNKLIDSVTYELNDKISLKIARDSSYSPEAKIESPKNTRPITGIKSIIERSINDLKRQPFEPPQTQPQSSLDQLRQNIFNR